MSDYLIKILFVGDFCSKPSTSLITVSDELKQMMAECDLRVVNFEVPLKPDTVLPQQHRERFFQNDDAPSFLSDLGFDLFSMANNHTFDWEEEGFFKTKAALGDKSFGAGTYNEAYNVKIVEIKGKKIGFLAVSFAAYKGVFDDVMHHEGLGCAYINDLNVNHVIIDAKREVDYLFVLPHDGIEYIDAPLPETIARYRDFIEYGADGVIASHPHCPQGWETYKGKPIFYSLGNFFFNSKEDTLYRAWNRPHWYEGRCVIMTIGANGLTWEMINTRNRDNVAIEIDDSEESILHNERLCGFLREKDLYDSYIFPVLEQQFKKDLLLISKAFRPKQVSEAVRLLKDCVVNHFKQDTVVSDKELMYMLRNDLKRFRIIRMWNKKTIM